MRRRGGRAAVAGVTLLATVLTLTACGSSEEKVREHLAENYELVNESGTYAQYRTDQEPSRVASAIRAAADPGRDHADLDDHYLGYEDVMVHVEGEPAGGSQIEVTDAKDGYDRWGPVIVPIWGTYNGSYRSGFSGGGSGSGGK
ncbi:DUF4247 domain-containing protein [Phytoactinopolyspora halotolerans]|uniref:DUF4247 domain-containing protein n=1 Tax=Phytoactinopolyspora halotolerans TaxID=1981512 RepID=A0A6L9S746_9ACTN|nr:DUF4247 domain-containing protein [Phytoactinopolyspora halotolerans]NEE00378.1 DUF4247 domain-containing protein [Phytoactinopolyspora halotolerans]